MIMITRITFKIPIPHKYQLSPEIIPVTPPVIPGNLNPPEDFSIGTFIVFDFEVRLPDLTLIVNS